MTSEGSRSLTTLIKIYDKSLRYGGSKDSLDKCLIAFSDLCRKAGVHLTDYHHAISSMLKDDAQDYYYLVLLDKQPTFDEVISALRGHFETEERAWSTLNRWMTLTFDTI